MLDQSTSSTFSVCLLLGVAWCATAGASCASNDRSTSALMCPGSIETPGLSGAERDSAFDALTRNTWSDAHCASTAPLPPTCTRLELRKDGTYTLSSVSDYTERDDSGRWNFALSSATTGMVCLDGASATAPRRDAPVNQPSAMYFDIATGLSFGRYAFAADAPGSTTGTAESLTPVALPAGYGPLTREGWRKTNEFDLATMADAVTFERSGRLSASYRSGECQHGGHFSWDKGILTAVSDANQCDLRGPRAAHVGASNEEPVFLDDLLVFYSASYRPASSASTRRVFIFDPYSNSLRVRGEFDQPLAASIATPMAMSFENLESIPRQLVKLEVAMQKVVPAADGNGYTADGPKTTLIARDYMGVTIAPHGTHADNFDLVPSMSGETIILELTIDYQDEHQPFHGSRNYLVAIP